MTDYNLLRWKWGDDSFGTPAGIIEWSFTTLVFPAPYTFLNPSDEFKLPIRQAFDRWEWVANLDFQEVYDSPSSDIRVGFAVLDGPGGTSAEAHWTMTDLTPLISSM
jgi:hypothetical protein